MSTEVKIMGKTYAVRSEFDPTFTNETAELVNGRMRELMGKTGPVSTEKVAILTAMNFAGELLKIRREEAGVRQTLRDKTSKLIKIIDSEF